MLPIWYFTDQSIPRGQSFPVLNALFKGFKCFLGHRRAIVDILIALVKVILENL